jgi:hypothetical protein
MLKTMGPPHNPEAAKSSPVYYYEKDVFNFQDLIPKNRSKPSCQGPPLAKHENPGLGSPLC